MEPELSIFCNQARLPALELEHPPKPKTFPLEFVLLKPRRQVGVVSTPISRVGDSPEAPGPQARPARPTARPSPRPGEQKPEALQGATVCPPLTAAETPTRMNLRCRFPLREAPRPSPAHGQPRHRPGRWSPPGDSAASGCVSTPAELGRRRLRGASSAATRSRPGSPTASAASQRGEVPVT